MKLQKIDTIKGGNGDVWMRLVSLYAVAGILPVSSITVYVPSFINRLAMHVFGDKLEIKTGIAGKGALTYTSLGIKDILKKAARGENFISPYGRAVLNKKKDILKRAAGNMAYNIFDWTGLVLSPPVKTKNFYQGFSEIAAIKQFRKIPYKAFCSQLEKDAVFLQERLAQPLPISTRLIIPASMRNNILVFPTGTARQFIPLWWAKRYLPLACYAFFYKDDTARIFMEAGLQVVYFYEEPGDIIELSKNAGHIMSTDSFPSHLLQYATQNCTIAITEVRKEVIISPIFKGKVVDAVAKCHPCLHLDRGNHPLCEAGYTECINWKSEQYTNNILNHLLHNITGTRSIVETFSFPDMTNKILK